MESFYLLIPMTIIFCVMATALFFWAVRRHQFDDLESAGRQILFDEEPKPGEARPGEARPGEARSDEARPGEARPGEAQ